MNDIERRAWAALRRGQRVWSYPFVGREVEEAWVREWIEVRHPKPGGVYVILDESKWTVRLRIDSAQGQSEDDAELVPPTVLAKSDGSDSGSGA